MLAGAMQLRARGVSRAGLGSGRSGSGGRWGSNGFGSDGSVAFVSADEHGQSTRVAGIGLQDGSEMGDGLIAVTGPEQQVSQVNAQL